MFFKRGSQKCLARFIVKSEWKALAKVLSSKKESKSIPPFAKSTALVDGHSQDQACILHFAMSLGAPQQILILIADRFPEDLAIIDDKGRTTAHIACATGASPDLVYYCIESTPSAAATKDSEGKSPVHHLCKGYLKNSNETVDLAHKHMTEILWRLYRNAPSSIVSEDNDDVGVIEYALESDANLDFIRLLHQLIAHFRESERRKKVFSKLREVSRPEIPKPKRNQKRTARAAHAA